MQIAPAEMSDSEKETKSSSSKKKKKSSSPKRKSEEPKEEEEQGVELEAGKQVESEESVRVLTRRFLRWTSEDLFDFNPKYAKSVRGVLNFLEIILSALVMILVGSGCGSGGYFFCHHSAAYMFVVGCAAFVHSTLLMLCCLLSKKGNAIIHATALELVYYLVFFVFFLTAGLAVEANLEPNKGGYNSILAGGVFGLTNSILFAISAIWSFLFFKTHFGDRETKKGGSES